MYWFTIVRKESLPIVKYSQSRVVLLSIFLDLNKVLNSKILLKYERMYVEGSITPRAFNIINDKMFKICYPHEWSIDLLMVERSGLSNNTKLTRYNQLKLDFVPNKKKFSITTSKDRKLLKNLQENASPSIATLTNFSTILVYNFLYLEENSTKQVVLYKKKNMLLQN